MMTFKQHILLLILAIGLFSSCVDDALVEKGHNQPEQGDTPYYINLRLKTLSDTFTRGSEGDTSFDNFQDGTHQDHAISPKACNFAIFFDELDKYIACGDLYSVNEYSENEETANQPATEESPQVESVYRCRFYGFANRKPKKVLVVVNAPAKIYDQVTDFPGWTVDDVMKQVWEEPGVLKFDNHTGKPLRNPDGTLIYEGDPRNNLGFFTDGTGVNKKYYFTMTNSTFVKDWDGVPDSNTGYQYCAQEFPDGSVTTDESEIDDLIPVTVYLERMVSKFDLTVNIDEKKYTPIEYSPLDVCVYNDGVFRYYEYKWEIQLLAWGLNGLETSSYLFKNLPMSTEPGERDWLEAQNHSKWNSEYNHRSFWSEDPHYRKDHDQVVVYPWQFDDGKNKYNYEYQKWYSHFHSFDESQKGQKFALTYYPFQWFCPEIDDEGNLDGAYVYSGNQKVFYTPENTFIPGLTVDRSRGTRSYELAGTHILLCARLLLPDSEGGESQPVAGNIYRNRVGVSYIDDVSMFEDFMNAVNFKLESQKYLYYKYYPWDAPGKYRNPRNITIEGATYRANTDGKYGLYYYNERSHELRELTYKELQNIRDYPWKETDRDAFNRDPDAFRASHQNGNYDKAYKFTTNADAVNADGKILPWICYREPDEKDYRELQLVILFQNYEDTRYIQFGVDDPNYNFNPNDFSAGRQGERIDLTKPGVTEYLKGRRLNFESNETNTWTSFLDFDITNEDGTKGIQRDENDIKSLFFEIWGVADCFTKGLMYYAVPIPALNDEGFPEKGEYASLEDDANHDFDNVDKLYWYYGVVRNNWYKFTLHSISELGIPVSDPVKPIVPNYHNKKDQVKMEMEIMQWHAVDINIPLGKVQ